MSTDILSKDDRRTLQTAAYGVVALLAAGDPGLISSTRIGTAAGNALRTATGLVGHALNHNPRPRLKAHTVAGVADIVLPALTSSINILTTKAPAEADNFRRTITTAIAAAEQHHSARPHPASAELIRKITAALVN
ncbi:MAG: hypothetical protein JWN03_2322 [Nocardia sp.]|uniref:hypothetical protein n=1 Tax=Nocardia sp. TaxID=1821 RepID=UPI002622804B|nr:hypothetical protein [Nocardia sp.]MCU1642047.1 hypothetical protein [Nocardia sp.]